MSFKPARATVNSYYGLWTFDYGLLTMDNQNLLDWITGGLALTILIGGFLMMFTTIFTTKNK